MAGVAEELKVGETILGYRLVKEEKLELIKACFMEFIHEKTGAKHIHIKSEDKENVFGVAFKTVPEDSTGVAHILEHTALCGSEKYPVRDPFFSMIKRSLNTFMNAFTASDWTMYPFASQNKKDFYNLMGVYLDAAFFPNLDKLSFMQEGHRLSADEKGELSYQGVVFNEMKGAMSSQSQVMGRSLLEAIYPDTTYGFNSGGEPSNIPELTHEDLVEFHKTHYHPSNSYFFTYGDLDIEEHFGFIEKNVLSRFEAIDPNTDVPNQPRWNEPREVVYTYAADGEDDLKKKSQVAVAWLTSDIQDSFDTLVLDLLEQILMGNSAAPLYKALIDSGLGSSLTDVSGYDSENRDTLFAAGLKNVDPEDADKVEKVIFDTLKDLAENGIEKELIETAVHQFEFHRREISNTPMPYGLKLFLGIAGTWFHGGNPVDVILFDEDLEKIRENGLNLDFFEGYIKKYFLDNPHRVKMILNPDPNGNRVKAEKEKEELLEKRKKLSDSDIKDIQELENKLTLLQENKEDLSCLPTLEISDVSKEIKREEPTAIRESRVFLYDRPTSEICYLTSVFGAGQLDNDLISYLPIFSFLISKTGTKNSDYVEFTRKIDSVTGGFGFSPQVRTTVLDSGRVIPSLIFSAKCLERYQAEMFSISSEMVSDYSFDDMERVISLLMQFRTGLESGIVQNGHKLAISLASRNMTPVAGLSEAWFGVNQLMLIKELTDKLGDESQKLSAYEELKAKLNKIAQLIFNKENYKICMVGGNSNLVNGEKYLPEFIDSLSGIPSPGFELEKGFSFNNESIREAWLTQSSVSFVGGSFKAPEYGSKEAPQFSVLSRLLKSNFLHREIREKGGAYGGFSLYNAEDGIFSCASYRDPNIKRTIDTFSEGSAFLKKGGFTDEEVKEAILQTASDLEKPDTPAVAAKKDFFRRLVNFPEDLREKYKEGVLSTDAEKLTKTAEKYFNEDSYDKNIAVITGEVPFEKEKELLKESPLKEIKI